MAADLKEYVDKYNEAWEKDELGRYNCEVERVLCEAYRYVFLNYMDISPEEEFDPRERDYYYTSEVIDAVSKRSAYLGALLERMMMAHLSCCAALDFADEDNRSPEEIEREYGIYPFVNLERLYEYAKEKNWTIMIP